MLTTLRLLPAPLAIVLLLAGCSGDIASPFGGNAMMTSAVTSPEPPRISPACVALNARIEGLRKEGVTDRAAQAASSGKSATVQVKRASLAQLAELDKANAEFQAKCSTLGPRAAAAGVPVAARAGAAPGVSESAPAEVAARTPTLQLPKEAQRTGLEGPSE